jgi:hypothetical protein
MFTKKNMTNFVTSVVDILFDVFGNEPKKEHDPKKPPHKKIINKHPKPTPKVHKYNRINII